MVPRLLLRGNTQQASECLYEMLAALGLSATCGPSTLEIQIAAAVDLLLEFDVERITREARAEPVDSDLLDLIATNDEILTPTVIRAPCIESNPAAVCSEFELAVAFKALHERATPVVMDQQN